MALLNAVKHKSVFSAAADDADTVIAAASTDYQFYVEGATGTAGAGRTVDNDTTEAGRPGLLGVQTDTVLTQTMTKPINTKGYAPALGFLSYMAGHGGAAASIANPDSGTARIHYWDGGIGTTPTAKACAFTDIGDPDNENDAYNKRWRAVVVPSYTISGSRADIVRGAGTLLGGGSYAAIGAPDATDEGTNYNLAVFSHKNVIIHTSTTAGYHGDDNYSAHGTFATAPSGWSTSNSLLAGTPSAAFQPFIESFELAFTINHDQPRSYTFDGDAYINKEGQWFVNGQECVITMTFSQEDSVVDALLTEHEAGTIRAWEFLMGTDDFVEDSAAGTDTYNCAAWAFGRCIPIPADNPEGAPGVNDNKQVTLSWRAAAASTSSATGWKGAWADTQTVQVGV